MQLLVWLACLGFACRALVPVGYMPAPLADGGPIRLCHGGVSQVLLQALEQRRAVHAHEGHQEQHDEHHDHGNGEDAANGGWAYCSIGSVVSWAALAARIDMGFLTLEHELGVGTRPAPPNLPFQRLYQARAPPAV